MSDIIITKELLATPRLLVMRNDGNVAYKQLLMEITLLEVSPSGLRMKYKTYNSEGVWANITDFKLVEILENKQLP